MSTIQAAGIRRTPITMPDGAGEVHRAVFQHTLGAALNTTDVLEIGALPARCQIVGARLEVTGIAGTTNVNVGFMSGEYGDTSATRTNGSELFAAATATTARTLGLAAGAAIAKSDAHRSIGVEVSANEAAGAKTIYVEIDYIA